MNIEQMMLRNAYYDGIKIVGPATNHRRAQVERSQQKVQIWLAINPCNSEPEPGQRLRERLPAIVPFTIGVNAVKPSRLLPRP